jgi:hypothetical protein
MRKSIVATLIILAMAMVLAGSLAGCGESSTEKAQKAYDNDVQSLKDAAAVFKDPATYGSVDSMQAAFQGLERSWNAAVAAGKDVTSAKISDLQGAFSQLKASITNLSSDQSLGQKIDGVQAAVQTFNDQLQQLK